MSSGGQNGTTLSGLQGMRMRDASDVVTQTRLKVQFTTNNSSNSGYTGSNAYRSKGMTNSYNFLFQVQQGLREFNGGCNSQISVPQNINLGNGINWSPGTFTTSSGTTVTVNRTIPTVP